LLGGGDDSERAIRWLILMMVMCCDPLAIALTAAASARRSTDHVVEGGPVQSAYCGLLLVERLGVVPGGNLGLDLQTVGSSEPRTIAVGPNY
jgi:hypothetical protein